MHPLQNSDAIAVAGQHTCKKFGLKAATCCKSIGTGLTGKSLCLGLGLGLGLWGPVGLVGFGVLTGYYYRKKIAEMLD